MFKRPKHQISTLANINIGRGSEIMLVQGRRKIKPNGHSKKQWVYDGVLVKVCDGLISFATTITCVLESSFVSSITPVHKFS